MNTNLFPAILLAGPPNCGKSVLAFLLTHHLRGLGIAHYLLRAAPDGEGDWFLTGQPEIVQTLRSIHKGKFSSEFILHMHTAIASRPLPLLVDIGGRPRGEQISLIKACTHSILLYRTEEERIAWLELLGETNLLPIAELRSVQKEKEAIQERQPFLRGTISGLERETEKRKTGMTFGVLLERVAGICSYDTMVIEQIHLKQAPFAVVNERELAKKLSVPVEGERTIWSPKHLARVPEFVQASKPVAIYGRGPVWLVSALVARTLPESYAIFDARYGWLAPPPIRFQQNGTNLIATVLPFQASDAWVEVEIQNRIIEPYEIIMNPIQSKGGIVLSGKLPRWLFAALTHALAPEHSWVAVDDPRLSQAIVVHSNSSSVRPGDSLQRLSR
jgi:CRISPR-associated protein Csx3